MGPSLLSQVGLCFIFYLTFIVMGLFLVIPKHLSVHHGTEPRADAKRQQDTALVTRLRPKHNHKGNSGVTTRGTKMPECTGLDWIWGKKNVCKGHPWEMMGHYQRDSEGMRLRLWYGLQIRARTRRFLACYEEFGHMANQDINNCGLTGEVLWTPLAERAPCFYF